MSKHKIGISLDGEINNKLERGNYNKSKLINWLLHEYFYGVNNEK